MSRTHFETADEIRERIDRYIEKRDKNLRYAEWLECGAKWLRYRSQTTLEPDRMGILVSACAADEEAAKLRSAAEHEDRVTLPKLKAKLAEMQTAPIPGIGDGSVARK